MKNKKGFTLVELLAVIVILGILTAIAIPSVLTISKRIKNNVLYSKGKTIEVAAEMYAQDNKKNCDENVTIQMLIAGGYLKDDAISEDDNIATDKPITGNVETAKGTTINMSNICASVRKTTVAVTSAEYMSSTNLALKNNNIKYSSLGLTGDRNSLATAYSKCGSSCSMLSKNKFNAEDSDYEDYRVRSGADGYLEIYRALYKYTIAVYTENAYGGDYDLYTTLEVKADNDNASDSLNFTIPDGYKYKSSTCYRLSYDDEYNEFQIYTSDMLQKNEECRIDLEFERYNIAIIEDFEHASTYCDERKWGFCYVNNVYKGYELEFAVDPGYKLESFGCGPKRAEVKVDPRYPELPYVVLNSYKDVEGDCWANIVPN